MLCLREPSLGPVFGIKGGAAGGGYTQVVPMEDMNLHFTGDIHAVGAANNLLAAMLDASILHGNKLDIDALSVSWRRCIDINDRALRDMVIGLGGRANGTPRQTGFDITAASEVMAIVAVAPTSRISAARLGAITVARTFDGEAVTAEQLRAAGAMTVLLQDTIKPNLVQTLEGQPALIHCGPFANIAHGNNSLVADLIALKLGDYVVTECGFGSEWGWRSSSTSSAAPATEAERGRARCDRQGAEAPCRRSGRWSEGNRDRRREPRPPSRHRPRVRSQPRGRDQPLPRRHDEEIELVRKLAIEQGAYAAEVNDGYEQGGAGAAALAEAVVAAADEPSSSTPSTRSMPRSSRRSRRSRSASTGPTGSSS